MASQTGCVSYLFSIFSQIIPYILKVYKSVNIIIIMIIYIVKVCEEEVLGSTVPLWWSSNGTKIAFASFDDTAVKPITLTRYIENSLAILENLWYIPSAKLYIYIYIEPYIFTSYGD